MSLRFFLAIEERLEEVCIRDRQRVRLMVTGLYEFLQRFGLSLLFFLAPLISALLSAHHRRSNQGVRTPIGTSHLSPTFQNFHCPDLAESHGVRRTRG